MNFNWEKFSNYYSKLLLDIYSQPADQGHTDWCKDALETLVVPLSDINSLLDVGCGSGFVADMWNKEYSGVTLSLDDLDECKRKGLTVFNHDISDLPFHDNFTDIVFARHVLEHSPFPILTLMEWRRVSRKYLCLVAPTPEFWGYGGKNHYSVAEFGQLYYWLDAAGWNVVTENTFKTSHPLYKKHYSDNLRRAEDGEPLIDIPGAPKAVEYRFLCTKL